MVSVTKIIYDNGTSPEQFGFYFSDSTVVAVIDLSKDPYTEGQEFSASITKSSFFINPSEVHTSAVPSRLAENLESAVGDNAHITAEKCEVVSDEYLTAIVEKIK